jgi:hypothetical protein
MTQKSLSKAEKFVLCERNIASTQKIMLGL